MSNQSDGGGGGGISGISIVVLVALVGLTGFYVGTKPLQKATPRRDAMLWREELPGKVPAFLWQDPLQATSQASNDLLNQIEAAPPPAPGKPPTVQVAAERLGRLLEQRSVKVGEGGRRLVLAMLCNGSAWPTTEEQRIRDRYAIVSGLSESGYVPTSRDFVSFFLSPSLGRIARELPTADDPGRAVAIPYEWFRRDRSLGGAAPQFDAVLLLWLRTDKIPSRRNLEALDRVMGEVFAALSPATTRLALLTGSSDRIVDLIMEQRNLPQVGADGTSTLPAIARLDRLDVIDWSATVGSERLRAQLPEGTAIPQPDLELTLPGADTRIHLRRTIGTDRDLLALTLRELALRGVDPASDRHAAIALVHEQDSIYARSMPPVMRALLWERARRGLIAADVGADDIAAARRAFEASACPTYAFLRGVDGQLPGDREPDAAATRPAAGANPAGQFLPNPIDSTSLGASEKPTGRSQLDYVRRLVADLKADAELAAARDGRTVRAVGVVGSSWEDKLPIIQAIREAMPDQLVFTNDLEAIYGHPAYVDVTRNLIVASHYDLSLGPALQRQTPPFRSSYQTSLFLATLLAVEQPAALDAVGRRDAAGHSDVAASLGDRSLPGDSVAQIAEIGPGTARRLALDRRLDAPFVDREAAVLLFPPVSAPRGMPAPLGRDTLRLALLGALALVAALAIGVYAWQMLRRPDHWSLASIARATWAPRSDWKTLFGARRITALLLIPLGWIGLVVFLAWIQTRPDQEPTALIDGLSAWPSTALRAMVIALAIVLLVAMWRLSLDNARRIAERFGFGEPPADRVGAWLREIAGWFRRRAARPPVWVVGWRCDPTRERGDDVWTGYLLRGRVMARTIRTVILLGLYVCLMAVPLLAAVETPPIIRGDIARTLHPWLMVGSWAAVLFVTVVVWDASNLCTRLIDNLAVLPLRGRWDRRTRAWAKAEAGVRGLAAQAYLTVRLVADRSRWVAGTVYFPVVLLLLLALATAGRFDAWPFRWSVVVALAAPAALALVAAETLRRAALHLRQQQIRELRAARELDLRTATQDEDLALRRALTMIEERDPSASKRWRRGAVVELVDGERVVLALPVVDGSMGEDGIRLVAADGARRIELHFPPGDDLPTIDRESVATLREIVKSPRLRVRLAGGAQAEYDLDTGDDAAKPTPSSMDSTALVPARSPIADAAASGEFDRAVREIEAIHHGAYTPPLANPVLKAALLPFGGLGAFQLFDYFGGGML